MITFPQHQAYQGSGLSWLGEIPADWNLIRAKYVLREIDERSTTGDEELLSVSHLTGVTPRSEKNVNMFLAEDYSGSKLCRPNDLVINTMWAWMGALGVSPVEGIVSPAYGVYRPYGEVYPRFLDSLLRTPQYIAEYIRRSTGIHSSRLRLYPDQFLDIPLLLPPLEEQNRIVEFLDRKTAEIDEAIAHKQRLIELLQEQKAIVINQAVTKGLNPDSPMRDSGVDWIGEVPIHWDIKRAKAIFYNLDHMRVPLSAVERGKMIEQIYDYYGASGIIDKVDDYIFDEPLILIGEDGANLVYRNLKLAFIASGKYWVNNHAHILKPRLGNMFYLCNALECVDYNPLITGAAQPKLTKEALMSISLPYPPPDEQQRIADHIQELEGKCQLQVEDITTEIDLFTEFRKTLIANAITGKIKV